MDKESLRYGYYATLVTLAVANLYIVFGSKNAKLKRALIPFVGVVAGVSVLLFLARLGFSSQTLYLATPILILMIVLNLRQFKICGSCANLVRGDFFGVPKACDKCGAKLSAS